MLLGRLRHGRRVGGRGVLPAAIALVEVGEHRQQPRILGRLQLEPCDGVLGTAGTGKRLDEQQRTFLPARLLVDQIGQQRNRLVEGAGAKVEARERRAHVGIGFSDRAIDDDLQISNRFREVRVGVTRGRVPGVAARLDHRGVHDAEHAIRFAIGRRDLQRRLRRGHRLRHAVLAQIQGGELRRHVRRQRIQLHRPLVGGDRAVHVVGLLEPMREQELLVRLGHARRRARGGSRRATLTARRRRGAPLAARGQGNRHGENRGQQGDLHA